MTQVAFPFRGLLRQDVILERGAKLETTTPDTFEAFCRAPVRLQFRHFTLQLLMFTRGDHHHHLTPFQARPLLYRSNVLQIGFHPVQKLQSQFLMGHFAPTEPEGDLCLVALFQKTNQIPHLDLVITFIGTGPELDLLDLDLLLLAPGLVLPLAFLVLEFPVVHDADHGRRRRRGDFNKIETSCFGSSEGRRNRDNALLLAVFVDQTNIGRGDFTVDARR